MFPGFVNTYKDEENFIHLYFFSGIDDNDKPIYKDIDLSSIPFKYICVYESENIKDYKFLNKTIIRIKCQLVSVETGDIETKILNI